MKYHYEYLNKNCTKELVEKNTDYNGTNIKTTMDKKITTNRQFVSSLYLG